MKKKLAVAQVSKADAVGGGASAVAELLYDGLPEHGVRTMHYCLYADKGFDFRRRPIGGHRNMMILEQNLAFKNDRHLGMGEVVPLEAPFFESEQETFGFDLFHFHDLSSAVSPLTLLKVARSLPVVWTMHDCSPITGGCLYPLGCTQWRDEAGCQSCPQHGQWPLDTAVDTAWINHEIRRRLHAATGLHLVSPSHWLAQEAMSSPIVTREVTVIPNGIDPAPFEALDPAGIRAAMDIAPDAAVLCFVSGDLRDERKNISHALAAVRAAGDRDPKVIAIGKMSDEVAEELQGIDLITPGYVTDRRAMAKYLAASDVLVFTSLAENHPLTVLEAMAAATAVFGYATGGVPEQVEDGRSGRLVPTADRDALKKLFADLPDRSRLVEMGAEARARFEARFTVDQMLAAYRRFYESVLAEHSEA